MDGYLEDFEDVSFHQDKVDNLLHRNFKPGTEKDALKNLRPSDSPKVQNKLNKEQGDIGEGIAIRVASEHLNMTPDVRFDQTPKGIDCVLRDENNELVVMEAKLAKNGIHSLEGDQMQLEWVERTANKMATRGNELYTPENAEIAAEIKEIGTSNIRRIVIATHPESLDAKVYEGDKDGGWKLIDQWNVVDIEQPHMEY